jgi:hypothetical protein
MGRQSVTFNREREFMCTHCTAAALLLMLFAGCGGVGEESIPVAKHDPLANVRSTLLNYANGQPLASEVASFGSLVEEVRGIDPQKAEILEGGLQDLTTRSGASLRSKAKELIRKLGLDDPGQAD